MGGEVCLICGEPATMGGAIMVEVDPEPGSQFRRFEPRGTLFGCELHPPVSLLYMRDGSIRATAYSMELIFSPTCSQRQAN
jgi:hypothetical protein